MTCKSLHKNKPENYQRAKGLRESGSVVEKILWRSLRDNLKDYDLKFRYQYPINPYIADFVCFSARLIVDIDGASHDSSFESDNKRQRFLGAQGFCVIRFGNSEVMDDVNSVVDTILKKAGELRQKRWEKGREKCSVANY